MPIPGPTPKRLIHGAWVQAEESAFPKHQLNLNQAPDNTRPSLSSNPGIPGLSQGLREQRLGPNPKNLGDFAIDLEPGKNGNIAGL